jgi:hypothetical protein
MIVGDYYSISEISKELGYSISWLSVILQRAEFATYRNGTDKPYGRQMFKYCNGLVLLLKRYKYRRTKENELC